MTVDPRGPVGRRVAVLVDATRTQLWPLPVLGVLVALALGVALPLLDASVDADLPEAVRAYLFSGGASAARTVLGAVAGSLVTLTSLTFSLTIVTLQLASGQFSPRLLRTFSRDHFVHWTLALFIATFVYALTVLRVVRGEDAGRAEFVPQISVTFAFLLSLGSVVALVLFLAHLAKEIRVETMLRRVHAEAEDTVRRVLPEHDPDRPPVGLPEVPGHAVPVLGVESGFMTALDEEEILAAALDAGAVVLVERTPGAHLVAGAPVAFVWPLVSGGWADRDALERLRQRVAGAISVRFEQTSAQNITFGLRQLTDVANKALSPGINDPTTGVTALGHSAALLCTIAGRDLGPWVLRDDDSRPRVALCRPDLDDLVDLAVAGPRRYGASDPDVLSRLYGLLRELAWTVHLPEQRGAVRLQLTRLTATAAEQDFDGPERARLDELHRQVESALAGQWRPDPVAVAPTGAAR